jgi:site-specific DNA recombinase
MIRRGSVDVVLAYAVDRISRNQNHIGVIFDEAERFGVKLDFVTEKFEDTAVGRFILNVRAFVAEVEREKIAERTMRGKAERARQGKLPQGTGAGCYGYDYNPATGRRTANKYQALVVQQIFKRYLQTRSFSAVAQELNDAKVPSFKGGRWYPLTIRRVTMNETYTGRTVYRRTKRIMVRDGSTGRTKTQVIQQADTEWIEVKGASPRIVEDDIWRRVQVVLNDPERAQKGKSGRFYPLRGRTKCGLCDSAMVGQTLMVKGKAYRYYRCRHAYDRNTGRECSARYVRGDRLESAIWREVKRVLSNPLLVKQELQKQERLVAPVDQIAELNGALAKLDDREARLVRLYSMGSVSVEAIDNQTREIANEREVIEIQIASIQPVSLTEIDSVNTADLSRVCSLVNRWLDGASDEDRVLALDALQVSVKARKDGAELNGVIPIDPPSFIESAHTSRYSFSGDKSVAPEIGGSFRVGAAL